jgi:Thrombospondin type 3 repeat
MRWALALLVAGCYSPHESPGAPCSPASPACPGSEVCVTTGAGSFCQAPGTAMPDAPVDTADAAPDAPSDDRDGDGVLNAVDNCPDIANADQADEDTDMVGDVCDPCPVSGDNTDDDHDGVANDCDPNPNTSGDHIALFEPFNTMPAGWTFTGTWTATNGSLGVSAGDGQYLYARHAGVSAHETVLAGIRVLSMVGTNYRPAGVFDNGVFTGSTTTYATACGYMMTGASDSSPNAPLIDLYRNPAGSALDRSSLVWTTGQELVIVETRTDSTYGCFGYNATTSTSATAGGTDTTDNGIATVGLHVGGVNARFRWFMIVTSP